MFPRSSTSNERSRNGHHCVRLDDTADAQAPGRYRRWDGVTVRGNAVISRRPLAVTRVNDAAIAVVEALADCTFLSPAEVADRVESDPAAVASLLEQLHRRGLLEWVPARDPGYQPPVSVVVTVLDAATELGPCLDALAALEYPTYEVVVVDDGSTDGTRDLVEGHPLTDDGLLRLVDAGTPDSPCGIGACRNLGVETADGEVVAFTDADCRPRPDWLAKLVPCLAHHDVVGGRVRPHGTASVAVYEGLNSSLDMGPHAARVDPDGATPYLPTANLLGRRAVLAAVGFPERNVAEDVECCWRALDAGYDVVYDPAGVVEHDYRDGQSAFAGRRADYGASEALLATLFGRGDRVTLSATALLGGVLGYLALVASLAGVTIGGVQPASVGLLGVVLLASPLAASTAVRGYRVFGLVSLRVAVESTLRETLSSWYALCREGTRYYAGPLVVVGVLVSATGLLVPAVGAVGLTAGTVLLAGVGVVVATPAALEWTLDRRTGPGTYARWYLLDHLGYQVGVYRGALAHRTLAHLYPWRRVRLTGLLPDAVRTLRSQLGGPSSARGSPAGTTVPAGVDCRTIRLPGSVASFAVGSSAEVWWFDERGDTDGGDAPPLGGERRVLTDLLGRLRSDDRFLDVGANVGLYACLVGTALDDGTVVAVEPESQNAERLAANLERNSVDATVRRVALADSWGEGRLLTVGSVPGAGEHTLTTTASDPVESLRDGPASSTPAGRERGVQAVQFAPGDALLEEEQRPTLVKVDVEGGELAALRGLSETLDRPVCRLVYCEVHPSALAERGERAADVEALLEGHGFSLDRFVFGDESWISVDGHGGSHDAPPTERYVLRGTRDEA